MEQTCQRCHETLHEGDRYCPVCGLPQLTYVAADMPQIEGVNGFSSAIGPVSGSGADAFSGGILWRPALNAALTLGVPAGILCFGVLPLGLMGMIAASAWAVALYARRARVAALTTGMGAQIGLVTGVFASWLAVSLYGVGLWFSRFVLHEGGEWDSLWVNQVERSNQQMLAQMGTANAQSAQVAQSLQSWMLSAEGRAGLPLSGLAVVAAILVVLAVAGGALGAKLAAAPRRPGA